MPPLGLSEFYPLEAELTGRLRSLVEIESPTPDKPGVDRAGQWVAEKMAELGAAVQRFPQETAGDHWLGSWGEPASPPWWEPIQDQARRHDLVLCLEPALPDGGLKTWRKGTGMFELELRGRPAHAGANPAAGNKAIPQ